MSSTPLDHDFNYVFSRAEQAANALNRLLPPALARHLDLASLQLLSGDSVDHSLSARHADLVCQARLASQPVLLDLLLEHQSSVEPLMPLRGLANAVPLWLRHAGRTGLPLPPLVPFVLYQG